MMAYSSELFSEKNKDGHIIWSTYAFTLPSSVKLHVNEKRHAS